MEEMIVCIVCIHINNYKYGQYVQSVHIEQMYTYQVTLVTLVFPLMVLIVGRKGLFVLIEQKRYMF